MEIEIKTFARNGRKTGFVSVKGSDSPTISEIAQQICSESSPVLHDITRIPENDLILNYLWDNYAKAYIRTFEDNTERGPSFRAMFMAFRDGDESYDEEKDGSIKRPSDYLSRDLVRYPYGVSLAVGLGAEYQNWKVDLTQGPLILTPELDQSQWHKCRTSNSVAMRESAKVSRYKKAVQNLAPYLDRMEKLIETYEKVAQDWQEDEKTGEAYLQSLAMLNLLERMTGIYSLQDSAAETINALAKEMLEHCGELVQQALVAAVRNPLKDMSKLYFDAGFAKSTFEYLKLWDPSDHYYFHTVVANSVDAPKKKKGKSNSFDERFFQAVDNFTRYLSADPATAETVADEANRIAGKLTPIITELAKQDKLGSSTPLNKLLAQAEAFLSGIQKEGDAGLLSTLVTWNAYVTSWLGTMEGPPTVVGLLVLHFSRNSRFVTKLGSKTLLNFVVLFGVDKTRYARITALIQSGSESDLKTARELFVKSSWRSRTIFVGFAFLGAAALVYHIDALYDQLNADGDRDKFDSEVKKLILFITADISNLGLVALTFKYSRDLNAFMASNMSASTRALASRMAVMGAAGWRVAAVGVFFKSLTFVGVVLSMWDFGVNWTKSDNFEKIVMFGTVAASFAMFLGALGMTSWLGPAGLIAGVVLGLVLLAYRWFKTGFEKTLRSLLDGFDESELYKKNVYRHVGTTQVFIVFTEVTTLEDLRDELSQAIADFSWDDPEIRYAIEYFRAGVTHEALAKIYDRDPDEMKKFVGDQWYSLEQYDERNARTRIELLSPASDTKLIIGVLSPIRVAVYNGENVDYVFLDAQEQWYDGDPDRYLADGVHNADGSGNEDRLLNHYDMDKNSVMLRRENNRTKNISIFSGTLRIQEMPPGAVARFYIKAPKKKTKWRDGRPDDWKAHISAEFQVTQ